jgi:CRP-like cAMP-binding protein
MTKVHFYVPGKGFGELALTERNSKPRAASIKATKDSDFAVISKKDFENIILESVKKDFDNKSSVLKNIPAFTHLTKNSLNKLTFYMSEHHISKDVDLFKEGEHIKGLYLIKEGDFEITRKFKRELKEKYKGHAFPVKIKRNIKCFVAS